MTSTPPFKRMLALAAVLITTPALAEHTWNDYHWARTANPVMLKVIDSTTPDWDQNRIDSLDAWAVSSAFSFVDGDANDASRIRKRCTAVEGQMRVCNANYGNNGWLGLASIYLDSNGHITKGTAKMNDSYASYWSLASEKNHVMCQEIGHVLGLGHTSEDGSSQQTCMDYSSDINSQWPNAHDYEQLAALYAHLDSYNSYDDGVTDSGDGDSGSCNAPPGKGCNKNGSGASAGEIPPMGIRVHGNQHSEIWVASAPGGGLWIHHLTLAWQHAH